MHGLRRFKYLVLKLHDSCRNFHSYGSYTLATPFLQYLHTGYAITFNATLHDLPWLITASYYACLPITYSFLKTYQEHHSPHIFTLTSHQAMTSNVIACQSISLFHPMMALTSRYPRATSSSSPHHHLKSSSRGPSGFLTKFY